VAEENTNNEQTFTIQMLDLLMEFRRSLRKETDRGCALMAAEYLSNELGILIRRCLVDDAKACDALLEDANGALATFSSRIEFSYLLGLVAPEARRELHLVRRIRNEFAHDYKPLDFNGDRIANRCRELRAHVMIPADQPRAHFTRTVMGLLAVIHGRMLHAKHAKPDEDVLSSLSNKELEALGAQTEAQVAKIIETVEAEEQK
jgi:DNA-binding MltR family transcriptional regulator